MVNPTLIKKTESSFTATDGAKKIFQAVYLEQTKKEKDDDRPKIKVSSLVSKMAFYYEKIRNAVDYKEEHLLLKNAIFRILKRQTVIEAAIHEQKTDSITKHLLSELIRAGYLPNDKIPEEKIPELAAVIDKYLTLKNSAMINLDRAKNFSLSSQSKNELVDWVISLAACDIEERLNRSKVTEAVINYMYEILVKNIALPEGSKYQEDKNIQIYVSIFRNFLKFDADMISFILFKYFNENWKDASKETIQNAGKEIKALREAITIQLEHPLTNQINKIISRYTVYFSILLEVIQTNPVGVYEDFKSDPKAFPREIKNTCAKRYASTRKKLWRATWRSIVYIFLTKSVLAFILEIPVTQLFGEKVNDFALGINITFPALLLFFIVWITNLPSDANTAKIEQGIEEITFAEKSRVEPLVLHAGIKRGGGMNVFFSMIYAATFLLSFGAIVWGLNSIGFNWISMIIFLFFLALVSFFGWRIRKTAHELVVIEPKENIITFLVDFLYTPVLAVGKWLSGKFSHLNVFVFILDFIIEAPFKIFVEVADEWTRYVKERKESITN